MQRGLPPPPPWQRPRSALLLQKSSPLLSQQKNNKFKDDIIVVKVNVVYDVNVASPLLLTLGGQAKREVKNASRRERRDKLKAQPRQENLNWKQRKPWKYSCIIGLEEVGEVYDNYNDPISYPVFSTPPNNVVIVVVDANGYNRRQWRQLGQRGGGGYQLFCGIRV